LILTLTDGETVAREDYGMTADGARELADKLRSEADSAERDARRINPPV
jgi:hypothetical protein